VGGVAVGAEPRQAVEGLDAVAELAGIGVVITVVEVPAVVGTGEKFKLAVLVLLPPYKLRAVKVTAVPTVVRDGTGEDPVTAVVPVDTGVANLQLKPVLPLPTAVIAPLQKEEYTLVADGELGILTNWVVATSKLVPSTVKVAPPVMGQPVNSVILVAVPVQGTPDTITLVMVGTDA